MTFEQAFDLALKEFGFVVIAWRSGADGAVYENGDQPDNVWGHKPPCPVIVDGTSNRAEFVRQNKLLIERGAKLPPKAVSPEVGLYFSRVYKFNARKKHG